MSKTRYSVNNWLLDHASGAIIHHQSGEIRRLGEYQLKLLDCLIDHAGQTLSRNQLTALVWERRVIGDNSLSNAIHALRTALEDDGKQQRVIKTIPKKGYMLDLDYCQLLEAEEAMVSPPVSITVPLPEMKAEETSALAALPPIDQAPAPGSVTESPIGKRRRWSLPTWPMLTILLLLVGVLLGGWFFLFHTQCDDIVAQEQEKNNYSNIRVFRIAAAVDEMNDEDLLKFNTLLKALNQQLIARDAWMTVYYRADEQVLNYTFSIESSCANQQLAMTLYHWRTDNQKLADILYGETQRKLNELAPCKKA